MPVCWDEVGERSLVGPKIMQYTTDKIQVIWAKLKAAQDRLKSYAYWRHMEVHFEVGDYVFIKISP